MDIIKLRWKIGEIKGDEKGNSGSSQHVVTEDQNIRFCVLYENYIRCKGSLVLIQNAATIYKNIKYMIKQDLRKWKHLPLFVLISMLKKIFITNITIIRHFLTLDYYIVPR